MAVLTADIGGTQIKLGIVEQDRVLARTSIAAEPDRGMASALVRIEDAWRSLCQPSSENGQRSNFPERHEANGARVQYSVNPAHRDPAHVIKCFGAVGLAFPGLIHPQSGKILSAPAGKFDDAKLLDLRGWAEQRFGLRLTVSNDANAALAAEWRYGAARDCRSVVMVTLGTGIGTSVIIDGTPLRGEHGQAGNLGGHFVQSVDGKPCPCGNVGCTESEASNWAVALLAQSDAGFSSSSLAQESSLDLAAVFGRAADGDPLARRLRDHCLNVWSGLAVTLIHAYDPDLLVFGGGVMQSAEIILPAIQSYIDRHAWTPWGKVRVAPAALGNDAGLLGVGYLAEQLAASSETNATVQQPLRPHIKPSRTVV